jgi:hypothetical protein
LKLFPFRSTNESVVASSRETEMSRQEPLLKPTYLIVLLAFDRDEEGELRDAFEPREMPSEDRAIRAAKTIAGQHAGIIAWSRSARPDTGDFREPNVLFRHGDIPEMD